MPQRLVPVVLSAAVVAAACTGNGQPRVADPTETTQAPTELTSTCMASGYTVSYPEDWFTEDRSDGARCRFFHPEPFEVPVASEATAIAIVLRMEDIPYDDLLVELDRSRAEELVTRSDVEVDGRAATVVLAEATGRALLPEGAQAYRYLIDIGGPTLVASALDTAGGNFEDHRQVLDRMMSSLQIDEVACSGARVEGDLPAAPGLPDAVAETRREIATAAEACDFDQLNALARVGDEPFTFSFGGGGNPASFWRRGERAGDEPLRFMAGVLRRPFETIETEGTRFYVWPSAFAYDSWSDVPADERDALRPLYGDQDFERFSEFGGYFGYRVGIASSGEWMFFVAGD